MNPNDIEKFLRDGWVIVDVPESEVIHEYAQLLEKKIQEMTKSTCTLASLHEHVDDDTFKTLHKVLTEHFWEREFSINASTAFLPLLKDLIGLDIMVQYRPFLRLARPNRGEDNIGFHRDTQYGQTPYELAVHIPFVDLDDNSALRVISGSHRLPESTFPIIQGVESKVTKGSTEHMLGRPYAPKRMLLPEGMKTVPLSARVGQAALFSPALFHGQELNRGTVTRVTTDMRFVNSNAKIPLKIGKTHVGYVPVSQSPVEQSALEYYQAQPAASVPDKETA